MAKVTLTDVSSGYSTKETINANNSAIETFSDKCLTRDGTSPNQMNSQLDMNSNAIINLPTAVDNTSPVILGQIGTFISSVAVVEDTAANIADQSASINTTDKIKGKLVWDTTNKRMLRASGANKIDDWEVIDGSAQVTPL